MDGHVGKIDEVDTGGHRARLRKRLLDAGPDGFHDYELIEYLLTLAIPVSFLQVILAGLFARLDSRFACEF